MQAPLAILALVLLAAALSIVARELGKKDTEGLTSRLDRALLGLLGAHASPQGQAKALIERTLSGLSRDVSSGVFALPNERGVGRCALQALEVFDLEALERDERELALMCEYVFIASEQARTPHGRVLATTNPDLNAQILKLKPNQAASSMLRSPERLSFQGEGGRLGEGVRVPFALGMALLCGQGSDDGAAADGLHDVLGANSSRPVRAWLGFLECAARQLHLSYIIKVSEHVEGPHQQDSLLVALREVHRHALELKRRLEPGDLPTRCLERLRHEVDSPPGIKSLAFRVLRHMSPMDDPWPPHVREEIEALVWRDARVMRFEDLTDHFGVETVIARLSQEERQFFARSTAHAALFDALWAHHSAFQLLNDLDFHWEMRRRVLERVLREDEGLALHGPALVNRLDLGPLVTLLGFLSRHASPVLWNAPWFKKAIRARMQQVREPTFWEGLYEAIWRDETFGDDFRSLRVARQMILEAAWEVGNPTTLQSTFFAYVLCSHAGRQWPEGAAMAWGGFLASLTPERWRRLAADAWREEDGRALSLLQAMGRQRDARYSFYQVYGASLTEAEIMGLFLDASRRHEAIEDWAQYDALMGGLVTGAASREQEANWVRRQETLEAYIDRVERASLVSAERVALLYEVSQLTPRLAMIGHSTIERWRAMLGEQGARGGLSVASRREGKLTLARRDGEGH